MDDNTVGLNLQCFYLQFNFQVVVLLRVRVPPGFFFCTFEEKLKAEKTQAFPNFRKTQLKKVPKSGFFASFYKISFQKNQEKISENSIFRDFRILQIRLCAQKKA